LIGSDNDSSIIMALGFRQFEEKEQEVARYVNDMVGPVSKGGGPPPGIDV